MLPNVKLKPPLAVMHVPASVCCVPSASVTV